LRKGRFSVWDRGHTEKWAVTGAIASLQSRIVHDDWKPIGPWLMGQKRYMERELDWLRGSDTGLRRWLRLRPPLMPIIVLLYCLFGKGLILNGQAGIYYALQRMVAEAVLSLLVLETNLRDRAERSSRSRPEGGEERC
jgi:hypothetical protein